MRRIRTAQPQDLKHFLDLAESEGWRVPQIERQLFKNEWRHNALVIEADNRFCGFVTAVTYQSSGWIGNLIVPQSQRGCGQGTMLFEAALNSLKVRHVSSAWLTASEMGRPLYERYGFVTVGHIERWVARERSFRGVNESTSTGAFDQLRRYDRRAWGEDRSLLLDALSGRGAAFAWKDAAAFLQQEPDLQVIGPWYSLTNCLHTNHSLLLDILNRSDPDIEIVIDVLASSPIRQLLDSTGFDCVGVNALMVRSDVPIVAPGEIISLASLGSIG